MESDMYLHDMSIRVYFCQQDLMNFETCIPHSTYLSLAFIAR